MRVLIGSFQGDIGTVELSDAGGGGLTYAGPDPAHVRAIVESERSWYDRSGVLYMLTDEEFVSCCTFSPHRGKSGQYA